MPVWSRRSFLAASARAFTGTMFAKPWHSFHLLPTAVVRSARAADSFLPEPTAPDTLRVFATAAVQAARDSGASYADVRVAEREEMQLFLQGQIEAAVMMTSTFTYGLRVLVDGAWACVHGTIPSTDTIAAAARDAVATARGYAQLGKPPVILAPQVSVTGTWAAPIAIDPFSVPLQDQNALLNAFRSATARVHNSSPRDLWFDWTRETRVFGSTDGSLITQQLRRSMPRILVRADCGMGTVEIPVPGIRASSAGYESVLTPGLQETIKQTTEEAAQLAALPRTMADVGRYPVLFDGSVMGAAIAQLLSPPLDLDRALGYEVDASGTSPFSPPQTFLGTSIASPILTVTAGRAFPALGAMQWDDEGVEPHEYSVIQSGVLVDYHTSRQTAAALRPWYEAHAMPVRSHGCAVAPSADDVVLTRSPHLSVTPSRNGANIDDLCQRMHRGIFVRYGSHFSADPQGASGALYRGHFLEIEKGKISRRIVGNGLQFNTRRFWKSLAAIGDSRTIQSTTSRTYKGQPWVAHDHSVTAPAAIFNDVDLVVTKVLL